MSACKSVSTPRDINMSFKQAAQTKSESSATHKSGLTKPTSLDSAFLHPLVQLRQNIGNQAVGRIIQAKLEVNQPGDRYEHEADRVADRVMRIPEPRMQRQEDEEERIQTKPIVAQISPLIQLQSISIQRQNQPTAYTF